MFIIYESFAAAVVYSKWLHVLAKSFKAQQLEVNIYKSLLTSHSHVPLCGLVHQVHLLLHVGPMLPVHKPKSLAASSAVSSIKPCAWSLSEPDPPPLLQPDS